MEYLLLRDRSTTWHLQHSDIVRIEGSGPYSIVHCRDRKIIVAKTLKWFEQKLPKFARVSKSHIVNRMFIQSVAGKMIVLTNGYSVTISRRRKRIIKS